MNNEHHIIYIPGLNDQKGANKFLTNIFLAWWSFLGFATHKFEPHWEEGTNVEQKLVKALELVNVLFNHGYLVSVIGQSAGGSFAFNLFARSEGKVLGAVNVCGRLRAGINVKPDLETAAKNSPAFKQSVQYFETQVAPRLSAEQKTHLMTVRAIDEWVVPIATIPLEGAQNWIFPMIGHSSTGGAVCTLGANKILNFLNSLQVGDETEVDSESN